MRAARVVAHRGSSAAHPDNTWPAFEGALAEGADAIECDVQATRDGVLVIRHDFVLGDRLVVDLSAAELEAAEPSVIRLADLFAWAEHTNVELLVEVKEPDAALAVSAMVAASASRDRIVVGGFHGPALAEVKASQRDVRTSFMIGSVIAADEILRAAAAYRVDGVHLCWEGRAPRPHELLNVELIERLRRADLTITLWHEEREDELRALVAMEPDAICTNTPAVLRRIVDKHCARRVAVSEP